MVNRRSCRRLGFQRRASCPSRPNIFTQAVSSTASATMAHQIWFCGVVRAGPMAPLPRPRRCRPRHLTLAEGINRLAAKKPGLWYRAARPSWNAGRSQALAFSLPLE